MDEQSVLDSTLPKEWSLLELPDPTLHTSEFEQIFGASDEENDDFPLSLKGLSGDVGIVGNDPQTSHFLISSIQETLSLESLEEGRTIPSQSDHPTRTEVQEGTGKAVDIFPPRSGTVIDGHGSLEESAKENEVAKGQPSVSGDGAGVEESKKEGENETNMPTVRKSARLQRKRHFDGPQSPVGQNKQSKLCKTREKGSTRDSEKRAETLQDGIITKPPLDKPTVDEKVLGEKKEIRGEEESEEYGESEDDGVISESDEDPDRLWCICRQPHNDRFMICCDKCGEWYHGDCIGISVAEGKKMEKLGQDYICIRCYDHEKEIKKEREKNRSLRQARRDSVREKQMSRDRVSSSSSVTTPTESNQYGLEKLFKPDNIPEAPPTPSDPKSEIVKGPCIGPNCEKSAIKPSLYCSECCIERHVSKALERLAARGTNISSDPSERIKGGGGVTFYEPSTRKYLMGVSAPSNKNLLPWLKSHPSYRIFIPAGKGTSKKMPKKSDAESKNSQPAQDQTATATQINPFTPNGIRENAKNAFKRALWLRCQDATDVTLTEEEVGKIAHDIEVKLFNVHNQEVTSKYRSKCRSLLFNLKDTKNPGLFRKVLLGEITTRQLVRMNAEQLASEELTQWREKTIKKELELIKEVAAEEAQMRSTHTVRKMTYKGEVEIERAPENELPVEKSESLLTAKIVEPDTKPPVTMPTSSQAPPIQPVKTKSSVNFLSVLTDTTDQHSSHVFDQNCAICLGRKAPPQKPSVEKTAPNQKKASVVPSLSEERDASESDHIPSSAGSPKMDVVAKQQSPEVASPNLSLSVTSSLQPLWKGYLSMHGMEQFLTAAYPVSGNMDGLAEIFPPCLPVVGRIAHVQVWDYIDKLQSSLSKEIAVVRFDRVEEDKNLYLEMMDYLIGKHRYGVFQTFSSWMKDMYLIPLQFDDPPPTQILPFVGPGLPVNRRDLFLGVIVRTIKHSSALDRPQLSKHTSRVHFASDASPSSSSSLLPKSKRPRLEVGAGTSTPPITLSEDEASTSALNFPGYSSKSASPVAALTSSGHSSKDASPVAVVSFYGKHKPLQEEEKVSGQTSPSISQSGIKSILSQLSDKKLQELASAMSSIQQPQAEPSVADPKPGSIPPRGDPRVKSGDNHVTQPTTMSLDERLSATFGYSAESTNRQEQLRPTSQQQWESPISRDNPLNRHIPETQNMSPQTDWQEPNLASRSKPSYPNSQPASYTTIYDARRGGGQQPKPSYFSPPPSSLSHQSQEPPQLQEQMQHSSHPSYPGQQQHQHHPARLQPQPQPLPSQSQPSADYCNQSQQQQQQYHSHTGYYDNQQSHSAPYQQPHAAGYYGNQPQPNYHQYGSQEHQYRGHYQQQPPAGGREREWHDGSQFNHHHWYRGQVDVRRDRGQPQNEDNRDQDHSRDRSSGKFRWNPDFRSGGPHRPWGRR